MAQIPQLERFKPTQSMPQNDRINIQAQDQGSEILSNTNKIAALGEKAVQMYDMYQADKLDQIATAAEQDFTDWNKQELQKLKSIKGDPTKAWADYDEAVKKKKDEMIASRSDFGEDAVSSVTSRLDKTINQQYVHADMQRGQQQEVYANNLFEANMKMKRDSLAENAGFIQKGDPTSFTMYDQNVADMKTIVAKRGIKQGTVTILPDDAERADHVFTDDNGKVVKVNYSPIAKQRMAKDLSDGVKSSLDVLISTGRVEEARELQNRYGGVLTAQQRAKIEKSFENAGVKHESHAALDKIRNLPQDKQEAALEKLSPEVRAKTLELYDAETRRMKNIKERKEKANYELLGDYILKQQSSGNPYLSFSDLENDPNSPFAGTWDNMSVKNKQAIKEMIESPKKTDPEAEMRVQRLFLYDEDGQDIAEMSDQDFMQALVGLNEADRKFYTKKFFAERTQSNSERRAMNASAGKILKQQLITDGIIKVKRDGKLSRNDQELLAEAQRNLIEYIGTQPGMKDDVKIQYFVKQNVSNIIKGKLKSPNITKTVNAGSTRQPGSNDTINLTQRQLVDLQRQYKTKTKSTVYPKQDDPNFIAYVRQQMKRN